MPTPQPDPTSHADLGGDPPCWAHLFDDHADEAATRDCPPLVVDLSDPPQGPEGAIWSLPHGGDLDANLVRLDPESGIGAHVNNDVDVLMFVQCGTGGLTVDGRERGLDADHLALIPKGSSRSIVAGPRGMTYLSVHRRRSPLSIGKRDNDRSVR